MSKLAQAYRLHSITFGVLLSLTAGLFIPTNTLAVEPQNSPTSMASSFTLAPMLKKVMPTVVRITVEKEQPAPLFKPPSRHSGSNSITVGSGVIIDADKGLIVTNAHVVDNASMMIVTLYNGRRCRAKLIGEDAGFDIAVIAIQTDHLTSLPLGDSDQLQVGDAVAAIGSPFGLNQTVTSGVVSALNRDEPKIEGFQSFIQTDTPINPGNSGGALVNMAGELIGINTAIFTPMLGNIGIGFAIPSNMVKSVADQLIKYGKVTRGVLGVVAQDITPSLSDALKLTEDQGVLVTKVVSGSPADKAGLKVGDVIEQLSGKQVQNAQQLRNTLGVTRPGTSIALQVSRQGKVIPINATVGTTKSLLDQHAIPFLVGMRLQNFRELENDGTYLDGIVVTGISDTSAGALAGIMPGDVIIQANNQTVTSVEQLAKIASNKPKQLILQITRDNDSLFLVIENSNDN